MSANNITKSLNLAPLAFEEPTRTPAPRSNSKDEEAEGDIQNARDGLYKAIDGAHKVIDDMAAIASRSQSSKDYEVLTSAIKALADISSELGTLQLKKQRILKQGDAEEGNETHNHLHITTADLSKMIEDARKSNDPGKY